MDNDPVVRKAIEAARAQALDDLAGLLVGKSYGMDDEILVAVQQLKGQTNDVMGKPISALNLSIRASNCLQDAHIHTVRDLVVKLPRELERIRNCGRSTLKNIEKQLDLMGLGLGTDVDALELQIGRHECSEVLPGNIPGLTKRELFAAMAMQGLMGCYTDVGGPDERIVGWSVRYADALLSELAKEQSNDKTTS